jgi:hypothetical protein
MRKRERVVSFCAVHVHCAWGAAATRCTFLAIVRNASSVARHRSYECLLEGYRLALEQDLVMSDDLVGRITWVLRKYVIIAFARRRVVAVGGVHSVAELAFFRSGELLAAVVRATRGNA